MISKKRRRKAILSQPPTGRRAFKGILHPLLLAGQSIAPSVTPATANFDPYAVATVTQPNTDISESTSYTTPCELSATEREYCDQNPSYSWCKKANLLGGDPNCTSNPIKCPISQEWIDMCSGPSGNYSDFCKEENIINGINGICYSDVLKRQKEIEDSIKQPGCMIARTDIKPTQWVNKKPCPPEFRNAQKYDQVNYDGKTWSFWGNI
jgi:hypothetical protein